MKREGKMIVRRVAMTLLLVVLTATTAWADYSGQCGTNLYFQYNSESKKLTIWKESAGMTGSMYDYDSYTFPKWYSYRGEIEEIVIEDGVTDIGRYAFFQCCNLTKITIANSVTEICNGAFQECYKLTSIPLPANLKTIGNDAFSQCVGLTSIDLPSSVTTIGESAFNGCRALTSITIPSGVTSIGGSTFVDCPSLTSITIPSSVTSIGVKAFFGCSSLTSITIPSSVTSIGNYTFCYCSSLTSITIPNSVTNIGMSAFQGCSSLTSITIPSSVTSIGEDAFWLCIALTAVYCYAAKPPTLATNNGDYPFLRNASNRKFYVPVDNVAAYQKSWSEYSSDIEGIAVYNITLNITPADGSFGTATVSTDIAAKGDKVTLTATPKEGYHFVWWDVTGGAVISKPSAEVTTLTMPKTNVILTAIFRGNDDNPDIHKLTLENTKPDDPAAMAEEMSGYSTYTLPTRSRSGYVFLGWATSPNGQPDYKAGETITLEADLTLWAIWMKTPVELADQASNAQTLEWLKNLDPCDVMIKDRELYMDGDWNTLCLPFDLDIAGTMLDKDDVTLMELDAENMYNDHRSGFDAKTGTLYLYFKTATSIKAGKPYLIKWNKSNTESGETHSILNPTFENAKIKGTPAAVIPTHGRTVSFCATYNPVWFEANDRTILYLGANNKLYYPSTAMKLGAFRAYFQLDGIKAGDVTATRLVFEESEQTGIADANENETLRYENENQNENFYDLQGRRVAQPTKGLYIHNGKKIVIK